MTHKRIAKVRCISSWNFGIRPYSKKDKKSIRQINGRMRMTLFGRMSMTT